MGGLPRRATFISDELKDKIPTIILDSGNLFSDKPLSQAAIAPALKKGKLILRSMERMGYQAAAVGELDLYLGIDNLVQMMDWTPIRFLSANIKESSGKPVFKPSVIIRVGNTRVGVFGLTSREIDVRLMEERAPGVWIDDPVKTAAALVPDLRKRCDIVLALTHLGYKKDRELAQAVEGIDVIVGGRTKTWLKNPAVSGGTLITSGYFQGRAMGTLTLHLDGPPVKWVSGNRIDFLEKQISMEQEQGPSSKETGQAAQYHRELEQAAAGTRYDGDMVALMPSIPDDKKISSMIREYRKSLREDAGKSSATEDQTAMVRYTGFDPCIDCHMGRYNFWKNTPHAGAIESLKPKDAESDPDCLPCHVTGYLRPEGYSPASPRGDLLGVQCEACHGTGSLHTGSPEIYNLIKSPKVTICLSCHTPDQDDDFDYVRDRGLVCGEAVLSNQ